MVRISKFKIFINKWAFCKRFPGTYGYLIKRELIEEVLEKKRVKNSQVISGVDGKIERVKRFAERNCHKRVCLEDAAAVVCLSPKYLSRIFKQKTGQSFSSYRLTIKIEKTKAGWQAEVIFDV